MNHIKRDIENIDKMDKYFQKELRQLLTKHFTVPPDDAKQQVLDDTIDFDSENALSMSNLIKLLIEQTINYPAQPYIEIDGRFWPHHIEYLLRCQIAIRDQNDSNRLKLIPFHM